MNQKKRKKFVGIFTSLIEFLIGIRQDVKLPILVNQLFIGIAIVIATVAIICTIQSGNFTIEMMTLIVTVYSCIGTALTGNFFSLRTKRRFCDKSITFIETQLKDAEKGYKMKILERLDSTLKEVLK